MGGSSAITAFLPLSKNCFLAHALHPLTDIAGSLHHFWKWQWEDTKEFVSVIGMDNNMDREPVNPVSFPTSANFCITLPQLLRQATDAQPLSPSPPLNDSSIWDNFNILMND